MYLMVHATMMVVPLNMTGRQNQLNVIVSVLLICDI